MAEGHSTTNLAIPGTLAVAIVSVVVSAVVYYRALDSDRPQITNVQTSPSVGDQAVTSRLWQDPFKLAARAAQSEPNLSMPRPPNDTPTWGDRILAALKELIGLSTPASHQVANLTGQIASRQPVVILPVMIPATPYAEQAEQRLRCRVAVIEGLMRAGYTPYDSEHIGFVRIDWPEKLGASSARGQLTIPYEWCIPDKTPIQCDGTYAGGLPALFGKVRQDNVLILWLDEEAMRDAPLARLQYVLQQVSAQKATPVRVIGPRTSSTLLRMVEEKPLAQSQCMANICLYAATPSAAEKLLAQDDDEKKTGIAQILKKRWGLELIRCTRSDDVTCCELMDELKLRCDQDGGLDNAVIISESDTFYGRALPQTFIEANARLNNGFSKIWSYTYLRGLDGQAPEEKTSADSNTTPGKPGEPSKSGDDQKAAARESPEGVNQTDYLRRLADRIVELDDHLAAEGHKITAVGVLGTDVYDKLLILKALRDRLPSKVFFTTILDARYAMSSEWSAAHNLVVVTPFGLRLNDYFQGLTPPFRDSYQTAIFAATLRAMGVFEQENNVSDFDKLLLKPRRYEISREGPWDLSVGDPDRPDIQHMALARPLTIHPYRTDATQLRAFHWEITESLLLLLLTLGVLGVRPETWHWRLFFPWIPLIICCIVAARLLTFGPHADQDSSEPLSFLGGISVWPTEALRIVCTGFCWTLLFAGYSAAIENDKQMQNRFKLCAFDSDLTPCRPEDYMPRQNGPFWVLLHKWRVFGEANGSEHPRCVSIIQDDGPEKVYAQNVWWEYQRRGHWIARVIRASVLTLIFFWLSWVVAHHLGAPALVPTRGNFAYEVNKYIQIISGASLILLCFWVIDATYINRAFITLLMKRITHWPFGAFDYLEWDVGAKQLPIEELTEYLDIRFIADRTFVVGEVIYYPFYMFVIVIAARTSWFDDWGWGWGMVAMLLALVLLALFNALILRYSAERARDASMKKLETRQRMYKADTPEAKRLKELLEEVKNERDGAFSILSRHPILAAILLPLISMLGYAALEYLASRIH